MCPLSIKSKLSNFSCKLMTLKKNIKKILAYHSIQVEFSKTLKKGIVKMIFIFKVYVLIYILNRNFSDKSIWWLFKYFIFINL